MKNKKIFVRIFKIICALFFSACAFYLYRNGREHIFICIIIRLIAAIAFLDALLHHDKKEEK